jgi:hypothetical protein
LVPVEHLINGVSIVECEAVERVAYFHVELDSHDVIVAKGAAAETLSIATAGGCFHNAVEFAVLHPGEDAPRWALCAPASRSRLARADDPACRAPPRPDSRFNLACSMAAPVTPRSLV